MESMRIYKVISERAKEKGISVNSIEKEAGLAIGSTCKWNVVSPTVRSLKKVADILECTVDELLEEDTDDYEIQTKKG